MNLAAPAWYFSSPVFDAGGRETISFSSELFDLATALDVAQPCTRDLADIEALEAADEQ